jgi:dihydrolipoamide dehydrogenase
MHSVAACEEVDLVVVGGGPAGYAAAFRAADLGISVTLVEREEKLGGVCLLRGCIPTKAMVRVARWLAQLPQLRQCGLHIPHCALNSAAFHHWRRQIIEQLARGLSEVARGRNVRLLRGTARFVSPSQLEVEPASPGPFGKTRLSFRHAIVASGSEPAYPQGLKPDGRAIVTSDEALEFEQVPPRMLVVGAGYIGLELAQAFQAFGARVTVVEWMERILPGFDRDLVAPVERRLKQAGVRLLLSASLVDVSPKADGLEAAIQPAAAQVCHESYDVILLATGRRPATQNLHLHRAGIGVDAQQFIVTDSRYRTSNPRVFAVGDCRGAPLLAHKARHEGLCVAGSLAGRPVSFHQPIPAVVFTEPEVATVGLMESEAQRLGYQSDLQVLRFPFAALATAHLGSSMEGFVKVLVERSSGRVVGAAVCGPGAGELIAEAAVAVSLGLKVNELAHVIRPHPSLSEAWEEAYQLFGPGAIHLHKPPTSIRRSQRRHGSP